MTKQKKRNLTLSSLFAMLGVLFSRVFGIVRVAIVNAYFGASFNLDSFNLAFRYPNSLRDLLADGALSNAFIKVYVDAKNLKKSLVDKMTSDVTGFFLTVSLLVSLLGFFFSFEFMSFFLEKNYSYEKILMASKIFKILVFFLPLTTLNAIVMSILGVQNRTFVAMNGSLFFSVGIIFGTLVLSGVFRDKGFEAIYGLAFGALLGALMQFIYQVFFLLRERLFPFPSLNPVSWLRCKEIKKIIKLVFPRTISQGAFILALTINTYFALQAGSGVLTYITTAVLVIQVPIGLFGVATGFSAQSFLAKNAKDNEYNSFSLNLNKSLLLSSLLCFGTILLLTVLSYPFYKLFFEYGKITEKDILLNSQILCFYVVSIVFTASSKILLSAFYALNATSVLIFSALFYLALNATLSSLLAPQFGGIGLGISYSVSCFLEFCLYAVFLNIFIKRKTQIKIFHKGFLMRLVFLPLMVFPCAFLGSHLTYFWQKCESLNKLGAFSILALSSIFVYLIVFLIYSYFYPKDIKDFLSKLGIKFS